MTRLQKCHGEQQPVIGISRALERLGGDSSLLCEMARFYLDDAPALIEQLDESLNLQDSDAARRYAHSLKGLSSNFDAFPAEQAAWRVESACLQGDFNQAIAEMPCLRDEVNRVIDAIQSEVLS